MRSDVLLLYFRRSFPHFVGHMRRIGFSRQLAVTLALLAAVFPARAATNSAPDFKEVYDLVRKHLAGASDSELDRAATEGLITGLRGKVSLVSGDDQSTPSDVALISQSAVLEEDIAYLRVGRVGDGLAKAISGAMQALAATNKLKGVVLDLRFASGDDYAAVAATADLFVANARPLLDWGNGVVKSEKKYDIINLPVAVLVNRETGGAAEALAAVLRETGVAIILGGTTAGNAMIAEEFTLANGQRLRIATSPVKLGDGTALSTAGVKPDIEVKVRLEDERAYADDAYASLSKIAVNSTNEIAGTNRPGRRPRISEADLVRERREGTNLDEVTPVRDREPEKPLIRDPALARAVDLLKGLAVVRRARH